ncbi:MAG: hypothetical protein NDP13_05240 [Crenarchaeota archaeon]|nr:hypothetical protein [Thermoproteota archaeon]
MILRLLKEGDERHYLGVSSAINLPIAVIIGVIGSISSDLVPVLILLIVSGLLSFLGVLKILMNWSKYGEKIRAVCILSLMYSLSVTSFGATTALGLKIVLKTPIEAILFALLIVGGGLLSISIFAFLSYLSLGIYAFYNDRPLHAIVSVLLAMAIPLSFILDLLTIYFIVILAIPLAELILVKHGA